MLNKLIDQYKEENTAKLNRENLDKILTKQNKNPEQSIDIQDTKGLLSAVTRLL